MTKGKVHPPLGCVTTKRRHRTSMPRREKVSMLRGEKGSDGYGKREGFC